MKALVNRIIHSSVVDGPGNRTAVFLQGCNYSCWYCHNPETIAVCKQCGNCVKNCPTGALSIRNDPQNTRQICWDESQCCQCDTCIHSCPELASPRVREMSAAEVMECIKPDLPFVRGITVSGGECSLQRDFLVELFSLVKAAKKTVLMDSNGSYPYMKDPELMSLCDGVMLDVKAVDDKAHRQLTGKSSGPVLEQAAALAEAGKLEEIRTVVVPGVLPNEDTVDQITRLIAPYLKIRSIRYKLIAYRPLGVREPYRTQFQMPDQTMMDGLARIAKKNGFCEIVII